MVQEEKLLFLKNNLTIKNKIFLNGLNFLNKHTIKFELKDKDIGFITASDSNVFSGVQVLFSSLKNKVNFICYDIGLNDQQIKWAEENGLNLIKFDVNEDFKKIDKWQTYLKPFYIDKSPFEYTVWIDSDCVVIGDFNKSELIINKKTFFIQHWLKQKFLKTNKKELYDSFPVEISNHKYINAGVFGINKKEDYELLKDWKDIIECGLRDNKILQLFCNWDEGALNWALQKHHKNNYVYNDYRYNCFSVFLPVLESHRLDIYEQPIYFFNKVCSPELFFAKLLGKKDVFVYHFSTCMKNKNKYWSIWD